MGGDQWDSGERYQVITLSAIGLALTPAGGSVCMRLKSRISLRRAAVDMFSSGPLQIESEGLVWEFSRDLGGC